MACGGRTVFNCWKKGVYRCGVQPNTLGCRQARSPTSYLSHMGRDFCRRGEKLLSGKKTATMVRVWTSVCF